MAVKSERLLHIYSCLVNGDVLSRRELAERFQVGEKSIQRDMAALRCFLSEQGRQQEIVHDKEMGGYYLRNRLNQTLSNSEILAVCKILLESRSMRREEMLPLLQKLVSGCIPDQKRKEVGQLIANEARHYIEPHHRKYILDGLWEIGQAIQGSHMMEIQYERIKEPRLVTRRVKPVGLMFSEYYFYLTAFLTGVDREASFENPDDLFPTIYRLDRIKSFRVLEERFHVPYKERFEEGEFRKRVQFMYGGRLERLRFRYTGPSVEAVLDRLPSAKILEEDGRGWLIEAEVFGKGAEMWLKSQGDYVERLPQNT